MPAPPQPVLLVDPSYIYDNPVEDEPAPDIEPAPDATTLTDPRQETEIDTTSADPFEETPLYSDEKETLVMTPDTSVYDEPVTPVLKQTEVGTKALPIEQHTEQTEEALKELGIWIAIGLSNAAAEASPATALKWQLVYPPFFDEILPLLPPHLADRVNAKRGPNGEYTGWMIDELEDIARELAQEDLPIGQVTVAEGRPNIPPVDVQQSSNTVYYVIAAAAVAAIFMMD